MKRQGQALLVGLLIIFTTSVALAVAGAVMASNSVIVSQNQKLATSAYNLASSCLSDTLMRMGRGQVSPPAKLNVSGGECTISITSGSGIYQILAVAEFKTLLNQKVTKKIQADASITEGVVTVISQQDIY